MQQPRKSELSSGGCLKWTLKFWKCTHSAEATIKLQYPISSILVESSNKPDNSKSVAAPAMGLKSPKCWLILQPY